MRSRRVLGTIAIVAIVIAAISFAVVDVSTSAASGCLETDAPCTKHAVPSVAVLFAVIGIAALAASVIPAIAWIVKSVSAQRGALHTDVDYSRRPTARVRDEDPEDEVTAG
ncbi:hypothetical protein [Protaetiibacter larvae]|uniref:Transmembrane protein n=1 Tax=Protaetiibacter larvae TaxID=2592654 RepID=A0A5C1YAP3_9MICO|nr:hypothetical protein [Protaetiibacter larvae]QEO10295.1 hypothetical protein FLP23_09910 [Protaetiibacter larvae]